MSKMRAYIIVWLYLLKLVSSNLYDDDVHSKCPQYWLQFQNSCYRFIKSPVRPRNEAQKNCQAYNAELVNINSLDEHGFILQQLLWQDPQHRRWFTGAKQQNPGYWINEGDGTSLSDLSSTFTHEASISNKEYLAYNFTNRWMLDPVSGDEHLLYICEAPQNKLYHLLAEMRTFSYGVDSLDEERGPYFVKQPKDVVFDLLKQSVHNEVILSCLANGYPSPTYQWYKVDYENDTLVATKIDPLNDKRYTVSGGNLIISSPQQKIDRGSYHCKTSNKFGSALSETVQLTFGYIGDFNLQRPPESGKQNWGKTIYCYPPQFYPAVKYYWSRDKFLTLVEEDKRVFVSHDGSLYFSSLELIDSGNYSCTVRSDVISTGRNGPFFPLTVSPYSNHQQLQFPSNFPKSFPEAPVAGQEVRLECFGYGYPVPSYNWTRKGAPLPHGAYTKHFNRALIIPVVRVEDQGEYVCRISNINAALQQSVVLSIQAEPNFTIPLTDMHMDYQSDLTWTCEAFGVPDVTYAWFKNGEPLLPDKMSPEDNSRYIIQDNILMIKHLNTDKDPGMYQCRARNTLKTRFSTAQLRVLALKPNFQRRPLQPETYASEGGRATILCNPEAAPKPSYEWKKDGYKIGSGGRRIIIGGNLTITPVSRDDNGVYMCRAQNMYGGDESQGKLTVLRPLNLVESLQPKTNVVLRQNFELRCSAYSDDALDIAYIWKHNGLEITSSKALYSIRVIDGGRLTIYNVTFADTGDYECVIKSVVGAIVSRTQLVVDGPPGPPGGIQVISVIKRTLTIQWTDGSANGRPILYYTVNGRTSTNDNWLNVSDHVIGREIDRYTGRKEAILEDILLPWSNYEFRVQAVNELGASSPSESSPQHTTAADRPYIAPSHVFGGGGKIGDLTITWKPLPLQYQNGPGIFYKVYWRKHGQQTTEFHDAILKDNRKPGIGIIPIPTEDYYTQYDVKVQAGNDVGYGPESEIVTIYSAENIPYIQPQSVFARSYNSTALNVSWSPIEAIRKNIRGKLIGHRLKYWKRDSDEDESVYYLSRSTKPWALIVGLQPNTYYYVKVMAFNSAGAGPESERYLERTYRKAPQSPPTSVFIKGVNPSTFKIVWRYVAPSTLEEPLSGYKVRVWPMDQDMSTATDTVVEIGSELEAYVTGLTPGKKYNVRVLGFSNGGDGRMSSPTLHIQMGRTESFVQAQTSENKGYSTITPISFATLIMGTLLCYSLHF